MKWIVPASFWSQWVSTADLSTLSVRLLPDANEHWRQSSTVRQGCLSSVGSAWVRPIGENSSS